MERFAHLSAVEIAGARFSYYRSIAEDFSSIVAVTLGGVLITLQAYCPLF